MLSDKMTAALNEQVNNEMFSAYLYLAMSAYFADLGLPGFASWFDVQTKEELTHGMKIYHHVQERGAKVDLMAIAKPQAAWESPLDAFTAAYKHEQFITSCINKLTDQALKEKDHATVNMLAWFVNEQVEEEASVHDIVNKLKLIGAHTEGLFFLDKELGARTFTPPAAE